MKITIKLQELLQQPENAILPISNLLSQKLAFLDCTGVIAITPEQLTLLFTSIPQNWDIQEIAEIFDFSTITQSFNHQLQEWIDQRLGGINPQIPVNSSLSSLTNSQFLDIFNFRNEVIGDYRRYIESFLKIRDEKVKAFVDNELEKGQLWTDPLVQLNPKYRPGASVTTLVQQRILHPDCTRYFSQDGKPFTFHYHQKQAFETAQRQEPYVVTTGTGSGKSLTYVVPIIDDLLHHPEIKGVRAILVYPMNALINSQEEELRKFLKQISPQQVVMNPGEWQHFEVIGLDQRGDAIAISGLNWEATGGTIDRDAYYFTDSSQKGQFTITATIGRFSVSAHVSVPPVLRRLEIIPPQIQLEPEENKTFTVIGFDQQDSQIALEKVDWKSSKGGSISRHGLFQGGYSQREVTVTASVGNIRKLAYVTLLPILRRLHISPPAVHLKPNENQTFTVIGFDQFGDEIDPGGIFWEASGGDIDQNGNFIVDFNAKGQFLVTATSRLTPKLTKNSRTLLFNVGISSKILSYFLRFLAQVQDDFITDSNTDEVSSTVAETEIDNFELELQAWITKTLIKLASRLLGFISSLCLNQATANLSASAEITVVPVLRQLEIYPAKAQIRPYESINFIVKGLDQHYYEIDVNHVN
ncbi:DEAD/DEAH box helicase [uncultured Nostoc sp.]|uniref:DEAD/DEAH box helicase n=1 Tax=uncultured Nostoc sp. TaxID=340711 RepID=UPI0035C9AC1D